MINAKNYFKKIAEIAISQLPPDLQEAHQFVVDATANGTDWSMYDSDPAIRETIDLYFQKLSDFMADKPKKQKKEVRESEQPEDSKPKKKKKTKHKLETKAKKIKDIPKRKPGKKVEHVSEEVRFIKRFVALHNKEKSQQSILSFLKSLQRAIVQRVIRKTSKFAEQINYIQERLIHLYNSMQPIDRVVINEKNLAELVAIAGAEEVYPSINIIKRYIGWQGKQIDERKQELFKKQIETALNNERVAYEDPYYDKVKGILNSLNKLKIGSVVSTGKAELSGLEGILNACGCKKKDLSGIEDESYGDISTADLGIMSASQMAKRKLHLLPFKGYWQSVFGKPGVNVTMMFHGEPGHGKTVLLFKLAQYLAENFGDVLFVSSEEYHSPTVTKKVNRFLNPIPRNLHFADDLMAADLNEYQYIILDSVNDMGLKMNDFKKLRSENPHAAFILVLQHTKAGDFKGGKDWEHVAEVVGEVSKGVLTLTKNRYAPLTTTNFFDHFNIEWSDNKKETEG